MMTSDAKRVLSKTIRSLRERLLLDLHAATESVYRLNVRFCDVDLPEAWRVRRTRLESWVDEQVRADEATQRKRARSAEDFRREVEKRAAYSLLHRVLILRLMEATPPGGRAAPAPRTRARSRAIKRASWPATGIALAVL